ncbi:MAG: YkgJ family cysteine cluster protein [Candidatus Methanomethylophilaceae archaeon]|nr:YkgJ family cysteine cluster protein [Candidatus Methanomethylophilaceae archaeon]
MAVYRGRYILQGLDDIPPQMEADLDLAYGICETLRTESPCSLCGRCCSQPFITIRDEEVDTVAAAAGIEIYDFVLSYLERTDDGRWLFTRTEPCAFLGPDNTCRIWGGRPEICHEFPYLVSKFMSRVYLAIVNPDHDILPDLVYMDEIWPCTSVIKGRVPGMIEEARRRRAEAQALPARCLLNTST